MNNLSKILVAILSLLVCAALGYFATKKIQDFIENPKTYNDNQYTGGSSQRPGASPSGKGSPITDNTQDGNSGSAGSNSQLPVSALNPTPPPAHQQKKDPPLPSGTGLQALDNQLPVNDRLTVSTQILRIVSVSKPVYNENGSSYTFIVKAEGSGLTYCLANDKKKDIKKQNNGSFSVAPTSSGVYNVYVTDASGNKSEYFVVSGCVPKVKPITKDELQSVLNSRDSNNAIEADFKNRVASGCQFVFVGRNEEEGDAPRSYNEIIQRVSMGTWTSVQVQSVTVNGSGKLTKAVIKVNY